ncbi:MAG TPA: serine/threonine-protein kinase, partial [Polyangiaceae bacterium]|nr:serine/threonine-protein kinase [Polyangiaceae bacterium]
MPLQVGDHVSHRYRVLRPLGQGGMARVFLVEDEPTAQRLVLKELRAPHAELIAAFRAEFALLAGLTHPRLTRVHDFGATQLRGEWLHYYTAAWIDGATLREHARQAPERWLGPLADALEGLLALHDLGVVHGDFTPDNVLVEASGGGVLIDLGCARPRGQSSESIAGTPGFLAPELQQSGTADVASDLYAVGVSLQQLQQLARGQPRRELSELISRLLAEDPQQRPSSVRSVLAALGQHAAAGRSRAARSLRLVG